jgi:hypothetical protein
MQALASRWLHFSLMRMWMGTLPWHALACVVCPEKLYPTFICPIQFFLDAIQRLGSKKNERGILLHYIWITGGYEHTEGRQ